MTNGPLDDSVFGWINNLAYSDWPWLLRLQDMLATLCEFDRDIANEWSGLFHHLYQSDTAAIRFHLIELGDFIDRLELDPSRTIDIDAADLDLVGLEGLVAWIE